MPTSEAQFDAAVTAFFAVANTRLDPEEHEALINTFKDYVKTLNAATLAAVTNPAPKFIPGGAVAVATSNLTLSGIQTIDDVPGFDGMWVLTVGQTSAADRYLWQMKAGAWVRSSYVPTTGILCVVSQGTAGTGKMYQLSFSGTYTAGTTALSWEHAGTFKPELPKLVYDEAWAVCNVADATYAVLVNSPSDLTAKPLPAGAVLKGVFNQSTKTNYESFVYQSNTGRVEVNEALALNDVLLLRYSYAAPAASLPQTALTDGGFVADIEAVGVPNGARQVDEANRLVLEKYDDTRVVEYAARIRTL